MWFLSKPCLTFEGSHHIRRYTYMRYTYVRSKVYEGKQSTERDIMTYIPYDILITHNGFTDVYCTLSCHTNCKARAPVRSSEASEIHIHCPCLAGHSCHSRCRSRSISAHWPPQKKAQATRLKGVPPWHGHSQSPSQCRRWSVPFLQCSCSTQSFSPGKHKGSLKWNSPTYLHTARTSTPLFVAAQPRQECCSSQLIQDGVAKTI